MTRKPISITIDPDLLQRLDQVAERLGETRTAVIERAIRNDLKSQEEYLDSLSTPIGRGGPLRTDFFSGSAESHLQAGAR